MKAMYYNKIEKLVVKAQKGDQEAFAELYHLTSQGVYFYALQLSKHEETAQDITQEVYLDLVDSIGELKDPRSFVAWINRRTYFISLNYLRKEKRNYNLEDENVLVENIIDENQSSSPLYSYLKNEKQQVLMEAIDTLSPKHKGVLLLKYYQGLSLEDIALAMDCPVGTITSRLSRAKEYLKETLSAKVGKGLLGLAILPNIKEVFNKVALANQLSPAQVIGISSSIGLGGVATTAGSGAGLTIGQLVLYLGIAGLGLTGGTYVLTGINPPEIPVIVSVIADNPENYTRENIEVTIKVENKKAVDEILVVDGTGKSFKVLRVEGNTYKSYVDDNGTYQVIVKNSKGEENKSTFIIDRIDKKAPTILNVSVIGTEIVLQLSNEESPIDWEKTTIFKKDNTKVEPVKIDKENNTISLNYTNEILIISIYDKAGNNSIYEREL